MDRWVIALLINWLIWPDTKALLNGLLREIFPSVSFSSQSFGFLSALHNVSHFFGIHSNHVTVVSCELNYLDGHLVDLLIIRGFLELWCIEIELHLHNCHLWRGLCNILVCFKMLVLTISRWGNLLNFIGRLFTEWAISAADGIKEVNSFFESSHDLSVKMCSDRIHLLRCHRKVGF